MDLNNKWLVVGLCILVMLSIVGCQKKIEVDDLIWNSYATDFYQLKYPEKWNKTVFRNRVKLRPINASTNFKFSIEPKKISSVEEFKKMVKKEVKGAKNAGAVIEKSEKITIIPDSLGWEIVAKLPKQQLKAKFISIYKDGAAFNLEIMGQQKEYNRVSGIAKEMINSFEVLDFNSAQLKERQVNSTIKNTLPEVKGLKLNFALIDTACEMYQTNITNTFDQSNYKNYKAHYSWLQQTYRNLPKEMKNHLQTIYDNFDNGPLIFKTLELEDNANLRDIIAVLDYKIENPKVSKAITEFYPYYYKQFFKDYYADKKLKYKKLTAKLNKQINNNNPDILEFMEQISGISFEKKRKPIFYYTLRPIGAFGGAFEGKRISTIKGTVKSYKQLFATPFHEYSHYLIGTFTYSPEFKAVAEKLKKADKEFSGFWKGSESLQRSYSWIGWCEEQLVEGFAKFLEYKYYGREDFSSTYSPGYDYKFYQYLRKINFDAEEKSLKQVSIEFYKQVVKGKIANN